MSAAASFPESPIAQLQCQLQRAIEEEQRLAREYLATPWPERIQASKAHDEARLAVVRARLRLAGAR